jgi:hypothetical protein
MHLLRLRRYRREAARLIIPGRSVLGLVKVRNGRPAGSHIVTAN